MGTARPLDRGIIRIEGTAPPLRRGSTRRALVVRQFFLDSELSFLEELDGRKIRYRPAQFIGKLAFETGVLELQCADMRLFHTGVSLSFAPRGLRISTGPDSDTGGSLQLSWKHIKHILQVASLMRCDRAIPRRDSAAMLCLV